MGCFAFAVVASPSYAGTIGYYRFESGSVTTDSSGNGRNLTIAGINAAPVSYTLPTRATVTTTQSPYPVAGSYFPTASPLTGTANNYAVQGGGANQTFQKYYSLASTSITSGLTVETYLNLANNDSTTKIIANQGANQTNGSWAFLVTSDVSGQGERQLLFQYATAAGAWGSNGLDSVKLGVPLTVGVDYYVAVSFDLAATSVTFYMQNLTEGGPLQVVTQARHATGYYDSTAPMTIGADGTGGNGWHGTLDEVRISDSALSQSQLLISVPEPASVGMALMGLGLILGASRRRNKKA